MAIIPLQIKMVYGIGKVHGYELDQGHIREFLATLGVGLTSQYLEQFGRKLLGGLFGKVAGDWENRSGSRPPAWPYPLPQSTRWDRSPSAITPVEGR